MTKRRNINQTDNRSNGNYISEMSLWLLLPLLKWLYPSLPKTEMRKLFVRISFLWRDNGKVFLVKYLKECSRLMQHYVSGHPQISSIDIPVSITGGVPTIVPGELRTLVKGLNPEAVRFILTVFALYRVIKIPGTLKLGSITDPFKGSSSTIPKVELTRALHNFLLLGNVGPLVLKPLDPVELVKSGATGPNHPSSLKGLYYDVIAWYRNPELMKDLFSFGNLIPGGGVWLNELFRDDVSDIKLRAPKRNSDDLYLGRLSIKEEAAGKMRVFAITDLVTQTIMRPLHRALFSLLKANPCDGTFNQKKPLERLLERYNSGLISSDFYSYDLSSATDRLPIHLQKDILSILFRNDEFGESWGNLLTRRDWVLTTPEGETLRMKYEVGQPMGALSSWAMLALTHHVIVQYCAMEVGELNFTDYALLGDDIVIANREVALKYHQVMSVDLGVDINAFKSLVSSTFFEFAKRLISADQELTPLSPANLVISLKSIKGISSLLLDATNKGWAIDEEIVDRMLKSVPNVNKKRLDQLTWSIKGPFGFVPTVAGISSVLGTDNSLATVRIASFIYNVRMTYFKLCCAEWEANLKRSVKALIEIRLMNSEPRLEFITEFILKSYSKEWIEFIKSKPVYSLESWDGPGIFQLPFHPEVNVRQYVMDRIVTILRNPNYGSVCLLDPFGPKSEQDIFKDKSKSFFDEVLRRVSLD